MKQLVDKNFQRVCYKNFKTAILVYLLKGTDLFSLRFFNLKNNNSQHNNSCLVWMTQNYTYFYQIGKKYILVCHRNFNNYFMCSMRWKRLKIVPLVHKVKLTKKCLRKIWQRDQQWHLVNCTNGMTLQLTKALPSNKHHTQMGLFNILSRVS